MVVQANKCKAHQITAEEFHKLTKLTLSRFISKIIKITSPQLFFHYHHLPLFSAKL